MNEQRKTKLHLRAFNLDGKMKRTTAEIQWQRRKKTPSGRWVPVDGNFADLKANKKKKAA